jgi:hypothetical protein
MTWRTARAFFAGRHATRADDISRVIDEPRGTAIVIADASDAPFALGAPAISSAMLDAATAAWRAGASPVDAIDRARDVVLGNVDAMGWMLFASLADEVEIAWVGLDEARQVAGGTIVTRTMPHSLRATHGSTAPDVATRALGQASGVPDVVTWQPRAGSRLVFANPSVARVEFGTAAAATQRAELQAAADELVAAAAQERADRRALVVIAERA